MEPIFVIERGSLRSLLVSIGEVISNLLFASHGMDLIGCIFYYSPLLQGSF